MKKILKVFHPNYDKSIFCKKIVENYSEYQTQIFTDFNFDVKKEIAELEEGIDLIIVFPFWWYNSPANFKHWIDNVVLYDKKYKQTKVKIHVTVGGSKENYDKFVDYSVENLLNNIEQTFKFIKVQWDGFNLTYDAAPKK